MIDRSLYSYGTVNSVFVEIQPDSTNIKHDPRNYSLTRLSESWPRLNTCMWFPRLGNELLCPSRDLTDLVMGMGHHVVLMTLCGHLIGHTPPTARLH